MLKTTGHARRESQTVTAAKRSASPIGRMVGGIIMAPYGEMTDAAAAAAAAAPAAAAWCCCCCSGVAVGEGGGML